MRWRCGAADVSNVRNPAALGMWPAVVLFGAFAWAELVYTGRTIPAKLALMITAYSLITWTGMLLFGRPAWLRYGDPFAAAFGVLARFSPTEIRVTSTALCRQCPTRCGGADTSPTASSATIARDSPSRSEQSSKRRDAHVQSPRRR